MIEVSNETQAAYLSDNCLKTIEVIFPSLDLVYTNDQIVAESLQIKESILNQASLEFVGCIATYASIQIYDNKSFKGQDIEINIVDNETGTKIPLFHGIVDSDKGTASQGVKTLEAYDRLYDLSNVDVTEWWNSHGVTTQYKLLKELLEMVGIGIRFSYLANGNMPAFCGSIRKVSQLSALDVLKQLCQASGGFGKINRDGAFQVLYIGEVTKPAWYPSKTLFPSTTIYPTAEARSEKVEIDPTYFDYYREVKYENFEVVPINKVVIRDSEDDSETSYGVGDNKYIVQGNLFIYDQTQENRNTIARNIYLKTKNISYRPFTSSNNGLPFIECGDSVVFDDLDVQTGQIVEREFIVLNRSLKGIQVMKDTYGAEGIEYQNVFLTDLKAQLDNIKKKQNSDYNKQDDEINELKSKVSRLESMIRGGMYQIGDTKSVKLVRQITPNDDANLVYGSDELIIGVPQNV